MIDYLSLIDEQLAVWPEAKENYLRLGQTERRRMELGDLTVGVQHNPARIRSTGADVSAKVVKERPCFLCSANRPKEQISFPILEGWDFLVNPFPIFPVHFTIASKRHVPQTKAPLEMVELAEKLPGLAMFFNGANAGASAPDHLHFQAVLKEELPLLCLAERIHTAGVSEMSDSSSFGLDLPFRFLSAVIMPDANGMEILRAVPSLCGYDEKSLKPDSGLVNTFIWVDDCGRLRAVVVPRRAHRPGCYYSEGKGRRLISPGAVDMAGLIICPRREDYDLLSNDEIRKIYAETAYEN